MIISTNLLESFYSSFEISSKFDRENAPRELSIWIYLRAIWILNGQFVSINWFLIKSIWYRPRHFALECPIETEPVNHCQQFRQMTKVAINTIDFCMFHRTLFCNTIAFICIRSQMHSAHTIPHCVMCHNLIYWMCDSIVVIDNDYNTCE